MKSSSHASIFLLIFLSHLLLLLVCFTAVVGLFWYLFAPGVKMYLVRSPLIVLPVILGLMGIAGLIASWIAYRIGRPLESLANTLTGVDAQPGLYREGRPLTQETHELIEALRVFETAQRYRPKRESISRRMTSIDSLLVVDVDSLGVVRAENALTRELLGIEPEAKLLDALPSISEKERTTCEETLRSTEPQFLVNTRFMISGIERTIAWTFTPLFNALGVRTGSRLFGTLLRRSLTA